MLSSMAIADDPDDDGPRLIYEHGLEKQGDPCGEFIRLECELAWEPANEG
jgi:uncharacterized protein (TIGR02996 family)